MQIFGKLIPLLALVAAVPAMGQSAANNEEVVDLSQPKARVAAPRRVVTRPGVRPGTTATARSATRVAPPPSGLPSSSLRRGMLPVPGATNGASGAGGPISPGQVPPATSASVSSATAASMAGDPSTSTSVATAPQGRPGGLLGEKAFKVYFDLNLTNRPGASELSFDNYHAFLFFEGMPQPNMQFSFDVNANPRFFELAWQATPKLQIRAGKIWIPFDDTTPHQIYGGRVSVSRLNLGPAFLPDIWADMGVGAKWTLMDTRLLNLTGDLYVVNGFAEGGDDPTVTTSSAYPSFAASSVLASDNNADKAFGGRLHALLWNRLGLGASYYTQRWSNQANPSYRLSILGLDTQLKFPRFLLEIRAGLASMKIAAPTGDFVRAGTYLEVGRYLNPSRIWKFVFRAGTLQTDDRVIDAGDQRIVGAMLIYRPSAVQLSLEQSFDTQKISGKVNYSFTNLRMAIMF